MALTTNFALNNKIRELWININTQHALYICEEKSPNKLSHFNILQDCIKEFLSIVSHKKKFNFSRTADILRRSVQSSENFNALNAASAWHEISTYANNLYTQPWRKEYYEIRLYSGFYTHRIEHHLKGAELMLEVMGYKPVPGKKMIFDGSINTDVLTNTSIDALIAMCECQVLFSIYKEVSKHLPVCKWVDILEYRERFVCSVDQAIRGLLAVHHYPTECCVECLYPYPSYQPECCRKCRLETPCLHANGYRNYHPNNVPYHMQSTPYINGHCSHVPTAKLIDIDDPLDPCSTYRRTDLWNYNDHHKYGGDYCVSSDSTFSLNDETVYRRERALDNRKERLSSRKSSDSERSNKYSSKSNWISGAFNNLKLSPEENVPDTVDSRRRTETKSKHIFDIPKRKSAETQNRKRSAGTNSSKSEDRLKSSCDLESPTWECSKCTYYNSASRDVCEMCGKSKNIADEVPLTSGGKQCKRCTLVNRKEAKKCEACDDNLEGSPTYV